MVEDARLRLEERSKAGELRGAEGRMGALMGDASSNPLLLQSLNKGNIPMVGVTSTAPPVTNGRLAQGSPAPLHN